MHALSRARNAVGVSGLALVLTVAVAPVEPARAGAVLWVIDEPGAYVLPEIELYQVEIVASDVTLDCQYSQEIVGNGVPAVHVIGATDVTIEHCQLSAGTSFGSKGLVIENSSVVTVHDCEFVVAEARVVDSSQVTFYSNRFNTPRPDGMVFLRSRDSDFFGNIVTFSRGDGLRIWESERITAVGNAFTRNDEAVRLYRSVSSSVIYNHLYGDQRVLDIEGTNNLTAPNDMLPP